MINLFGRGRNLENDEDRERTAQAKRITEQHPNFGIYDTRATIH